MLWSAIPLDSAMTVGAALERLARHGVWDDPRHLAAAVIEEYRAILAAAGKTIDFTEAERQLRKNPTQLGVAIRRQWYDQILWYARTAQFVLERCRGAQADEILLYALQLHESDSQPAIPISAIGEIPRGEGVVLDGGLPVGINLLVAQREAPKGTRRRGRPSVDRGMPSRSTASEEKIVALPRREQIQAWPLLNSPANVAAGIEFEVTVALANHPQAGVQGGPLRLPVQEAVKNIELAVELMVDGADAPQGWERALVVPVDDPSSARPAVFKLIGRPPAGTEPVHLTFIEVRYLLSGTVCGIASRPIEIRATGYVPPPNLEIVGTPWTQQLISTPPMNMEADDQVADLTIEIAKPDGNPASGRYVCRLYSPHPIKADRGPHEIDFGQDTKTFARTIVDRIREYGSDPLVKKLLESYGMAVAEKMPLAAHDAIHEVAILTSPNPPAVLVVSAEPYVPWELAYIDPPLDPSLPQFLGVQTLLGRWLRDSGSAASPSTFGGIRVQRPPIQPTGKIPVRHMAVMAGLYKMQSGLRSLPEAEKEADELVKNYAAIPLAASSQALLQLLDAQLEHQFKQVGGPDAVHFAGHGDFNPASPDASVMLLSDGRPLSSDFFRSAKYGGKQQPLIFLNACMIGIGGELLGNMGGFPGNCLKGGFGGVLGALWEVNDSVAREFALEFWQRALPMPSGTPEEVGSILRNLRANYDPSSPVPSYLAYVYYGHPRLTLERVT
jgi:hypothetical protein